MLKDDLTIMISSCDAYEDCWYPFFKLFDKFGGELKNCDIILNTESKKYTYGNLNIRCPNNYVEKLQWGERFKRTLDKIKTTFILTFLDDYFIREPIDVTSIEKVITYMKDNDKIGCFNLSVLTTLPESPLYKNFCVVPLKMSYRCNTQVAIWRKDVLYNSMLYCDTPWSWEILGNVRNSYVLKDIDIYSFKEGLPLYINFGHFEYKVIDGKKVRIAPNIIQGKWGVESVDELFKNNGIDIDYSIRGEFHGWDYKKESTQVKQLKQPKKPSKISGAISKIKRKSVQMIKELFHIKPKNQAEKDYYNYVNNPIANYKKHNENWDKLKTL